MLLQWLPYIGEDAYTVSTLPIHRDIAPLVCFHGIQWHRPDRVLRQFGMAQTIVMWKVPEGDIMALSEINMRNIGQMSSLMQQCVMIWGRRFDHVTSCEAMEDPESWHFHEEYAQSHHRHTRRFISRRGAVMESTVCSFVVYTYNLESADPLILYVFICI
ncbi:Serine/threonine-protein phosphatase 7 long form homolog [Linum grandiflorum]